MRCDHDAMTLQPASLGGGKGGQAAVPCVEGLHAHAGRLEHRAALLAVAEEGGGAASVLAVDTEAAEGGAGAPQRDAQLTALLGAGRCASCTQITDLEDDSALSVAGKAGGAGLPVPGDVAHRAPALRPDLHLNLFQVHAGAAACLAVGHSGAHVDTVAHALQAASRHGVVNEGHGVGGVEAGTGAGAEGEVPLSLRDGRRGG